MYDTEEFTIAWRYEQYGVKIFFSSFDFQGIMLANNTESMNEALSKMLLDTGIVKLEVWKIEKSLEKDY